jgi:hypothetical protein
MSGCLRNFPARYFVTAKGILQFVFKREIVTLIEVSHF